MNKALTLTAAALGAIATIGLGTLPGTTPTANAWSVDTRNDPPSLNLRLSKGETDGIADGTANFAMICTAAAVKYTVISVPVCAAASTRAIVAAKEARAKGKCAYFKVLTLPVPMFTWWSSYDC